MEVAIPNSKIKKICISKKKSGKGFACSSCGSVWNEMTTEKNRVRIRQKKWDIMIWIGTTKQGNVEALCWRESVSAVQSGLDSAVCVYFSRMRRICVSICQVENRRGHYLESLLAEPRWRDLRWKGASSKTMGERAFLTFSILQYEIKCWEMPP